MGGMPRAAAVISIVIAAVFFVFSGTAAAAAPCEERVLVDWSDNGRVDGIYPLRCYEGALESMPTDLRDYTNATEAIERALAAAATKAAPRTASGDRVAAGEPEVAASAPTALPLPLVALAGISFAVFAAGGLGYLSRRRREQRQA